MQTLTANEPQLFLDDAWVADHRRIVRRWLEAKVRPEPVILPDRPWEGRAIVLYGTVLGSFENGYRLYYSSFTPAVEGRPHVHSKVCLALSEDGFRWKKPLLGAVEWEGSRENNIVLDPGRIQDGVSLIHEPDDAEHPWKMLAFEADDPADVWGEGWGLFAYRSIDGAAWRPVPGRRAKAGDRTNLMAEKVDGRYVAYTRHPRMFALRGCRTIWRIESPDFLSWSEPEEVLAPDLADPAEVEFYGMSVFRRRGWFFGLLEYWRSDIDAIETHLVFSRDGKNWNRPSPRAPFIRAAHDWNRKWVSCASNGPVLIGDRMVFHFGGRSVSHHWDAAHQDGVIGYASLGIDRFCALEGGPGGRVDTVPFVWPGGTLSVNADTRDSFESHPGQLNGEMAVEALDPEGRVLPAWGDGQRAVFRGNTHCRGAAAVGEVLWPGGRSLDALKGTPVRLRFHLRHARLFSFAAAPAAPKSP